MAREEMADVEVAITADGVILGIRMDVKVNLGAYPGDPFPGSMIAFTMPGSFQGALKLEAIECNAKVLFTNKATYVSYRGPWASADFLRERLLDLIAHELGVDPLEIRRRNYVIRDEPPLAMLNGRPFVGITTRETLDQAADIVDWDGFRARQRAAARGGSLPRHRHRRRTSRARPGPKVPGQEGPDLMGHEVTHLSIDARRQGRRSSPASNRTGRATRPRSRRSRPTSSACRFEDVIVKYGDTDITPIAIVGTGGSRAATMANGVVLHGSRELREKVLALAADVLEANAADLEMRGSVVSVKGTPSVTLALAELARIVAEEPERLPEGADLDL